MLKIEKVDNCSFAGTDADSEPMPIGSTSASLSAKPNVMRSAFVKAWITRQSAFSIQCGGLERLMVHFSKPTYFFEKYNENDRDLFYGVIKESEGFYKKYGWYEPNKKTWVPSLSVGNWLAYDNPVSEFIWEELKKHFKNKPFDTWDELEKIGECKVEDFCLEITLDVSVADA